MNQFNKHHLILALLTIIPLLLILGLMAPLAQDQEYHGFADTITYFAIPNFHNVFSNILFLVFPVIGFIDYKKNKKNYTISWAVFLFGVLLVGPGSAYYHYAPGDSTLFWDRLPMTIGFMGLTSFVFTEVFKLKAEKLLLSILLAIGFYSLFHWVQFNDLRVYFWVQLTPFLTILYIAIALPTSSLKPKYLIFAVIFYALAKLTEYYDHGIHDALGYSGHSIKHFLAAFSVYSLVLMKSSRGKHQ